jgi:hypothetical protein
MLRFGNVALLHLAPGIKETSQAAGNFTKRSYGRQRGFTEYIEANFQPAAIDTTTGEPSPSSSIRQ